MTRFTEKPRTVYFIVPVGLIGPVKIGCSDNPETRRQQLQGPFGSPLEIATTTPGNMDDERKIHSLFWHSHIGGEWFNWSAELQTFIDAITTGWFNLSGLPEAKVRRMPNKRRPWTEDQKLRARLTRELAKAARKTGRHFHHHLNDHSLNKTWKDLIPEVERLLGRAA